MSWTGIGQDNCDDSGIFEFSPGKTIIVYDNDPV